jgi:hypothetical protein
VISRGFSLSALALAALVAACEDEQAPAPAVTGLEIVSGDNQYTRKGTQLEEPVVVQLTLEDGQAASGATVLFQVIEGGGSLSRTSATTAGSGRVSVNWTVGANPGNNRLRISLADNSAVNVVASATASEFYCPEEDPAFSRKFLAQHDLLLLTRSSSLTQDDGSPVAGLVRIVPDFTEQDFLGTSLRNYGEDLFDNVVRDCVFATNGDFYLSWNNITDEIVKVATDGTVSHFATLETSFGAEIAMTPGGILVGCDERGPFAVTCRDTVFRYEGALYSGTARDAANNDAVAADPTTGDVYFIYKEDRRLKRIPLDGVAQAGDVADVAVVPIEVSDGARGMVVDGTDGSVYILVDYAGTPVTKAIVKVTSAGAVTTEFDFFSRGAGDAAGVQSDLAIDRGFRFLYTLDTKNNVVLLYGIASQQLAVLESTTDPEAASNAVVGERVGLDVLP